MRDIWYCAVSGQQIGPMTLRELKTTLPTFPNAEDVLIWHESFSGWLTAREAAALISDDRLFRSLLAPTTIESERYSSVAGFLLGTIVIALGCSLFYLGITGQEKWVAHVLGLSSNAAAASPGALMFIVGLLVIRATRYRVSVK